ncbi:MAG: type IV pilin-like G/H family protein [Cyanobacteria bacterium P01_A01_bin.135]
MTNFETLARAHQGDPAAIAALLTRALQARGITVKANRTEQALQLLLVAAQAPEQASAIAALQPRLQALKLPSQQVIVYGRRAASPVPAWTQTLSLVSGPQPEAAEVDTSGRDAELGGKPKPVKAKTGGPKQINPGATSPQRSRSTQGRRRPPCPRSFLIPSILATFLAFPVTGLIALLFSLQVEQRYRAGDDAGAKSASNRAKNFCWISVGIVGSLYALLLLLWGGAILMQASRPVRPTRSSVQSSQALTFMGSMIRAQVAYYRENRRFAGDADALGLGLSLSGGYRYEVLEIAPEQVMMAADPDNQTLSAYRGAIFLTADGQFHYGICRTDSATPPVSPTFRAGIMGCDAPATLLGEDTASISP